MFLFIRRQWSPEIAYLAALGAAVVGFAVFVCVSAYNDRPMGAEPTKIVGLDAVTMANPAPAPTSVSENWPSDPVSPENFNVAPPAIVAIPSARAPVSPRPPIIPRFGDSAPLPPSRPADVGEGAAPPVPVPRPHEATPERKGIVQRQVASLGPSPRYDQFTAVYDLKAHTVILPNGVRLEAHSGLGELRDDPSHVNERDRGATPPHVYELTPREELFHGVQALRLNPVGEGDVFGRDGLLAHTYMLGPKGDSNGCVSFKEYDAFLEAFKSGLVKRLAVVVGLDAVADARRP